MTRPCTDHHQARTLVAWFTAAPAANSACTMPRCPSSLARYSGGVSINCAPPAHANRSHTHTPQSTITLLNQARQSLAPILQVRDTVPSWSGLLLHPTPKATSQLHRGPSSSRHIAGVYRHSANTPLRKNGHLKNARHTSARESALRTHLLGMGAKWPLTALAWCTAAPAASSVLTTTSRPYSLAVYKAVAPLPWAHTHHKHHTMRRTDAQFATHPRAGRHTGFDPSVQFTTAPSCSAVFTASSSPSLAALNNCLQRQQLDR